MAKFGELAELYDPGLTLTVKDREYTLPLPSAELGLWCRTLTETVFVYEDASEAEREKAFERIGRLPDLAGGESLWERLLGPVYQQMMADDVEDPYIQFCAWTALLNIVHGEEAAQRFWEAGGRPEAPGPSNRAERRQAAKSAGSSTAAAATTPPPTSTSGTRMSQSRRRRPRRRS